MGLHLVWNLWYYESWFQENSSKSCMKAWCGTGQPSAFSFSFHNNPYKGRFRKNEALLWRHTTLMLSACNSTYVQGTRILTIGGLIGWNMIKKTLRWGRLVFSEPVHKQWFFTQVLTWQGHRLLRNCLSIWTDLWRTDKQWKEDE